MRCPSCKSGETEGQRVYQEHFQVRCGHCKLRWLITEDQMVRQSELIVTINSAEMALEELEKKILKQVTVASPPKVVFKG